MSKAKRSTRARWVTGALVATLLATGCGSVESSASDAPRFIYITSSPIGQNTFLMTGKTGIEAVAESTGGSVRVYESKDHDTQMSNLRSAVAEAPEVIVMAGVHFDDSVVEVASQNSKQLFLLVDAPVENAPANLYQATFREQEAGYLLGVEAGLLTETNTVGAVLSSDTSVMHKYFAGFEDGARNVNPEVRVIPAEVLAPDTPLDDTLRAREAATRIADEGADHIFAIGSGVSAGVIEAVEAAGISMFGVDAARCASAPGLMTDSAIKAVDHVIETVVLEMLAGKPSSDVSRSFGIAERSMGLASLTGSASDSECTVTQNPKVLDQVSQLSDAIADEKVTPPEA
ncbi:MAG: BMP family ABC transporter substrate-binding protein [Leucobacter sp.]